MKKRAGLVAAGLAACVLVAAAGTGIAADATAKAKGETLLAFFDGEAVSKGEVRTVFFFVEPFTASFQGRFDGRVLDLDEHFRFADNAPHQLWRLVDEGDGRLTGTVRTERGDGAFSPPVAVKGELERDRLTLDYDGYVPGGGETVLHFHHAMRRVADGTVRNDVTVSKFYLPIATSTVTFAKRRITPSLMERTGPPSGPVSSPAENTPFRPSRL